MDRVDGLVQMHLVIIETPHESIWIGWVQLANLEAFLEVGRIVKLLLSDKQIISVLAHKLGDG